MLKFTCSKLYDNIPIAHRQQNHQGPCSKIHGHDWAFHFTFACNDRDPVTGFVVDFGDLRQLKNEVERFDHALAINKSDKGMASLLSTMHATDLSIYEYFNIIWVEDCTCEGFAAYFFTLANRYILEKTEGRVWCESITVEEGRVNSASVYADITPEDVN